MIPVIKNKYGLKFETNHLPKEGAIVIANHVTSFDQFFLAAMFHEPIYYVASIDIFERAVLGKLIDHLVAPIHKEKSKKSDLACIRDCMSVAKENGNIGIFVEGNRTYSGKLGFVDPSIIKLCKMIKKPIYCVRIEGGYGIEPRWGKKSRKGSMKSYVSRIIPFDEYEKMDNDQLYKLVVDSIKSDDFNTGNKYKCKEPALFAERVLFKCPVCGHMHTITSKGEHIKCTNCNLDVIYHDDLSFSSNKKEFKFKNISEWYDYQLNELKAMDFDNMDTIFEDKKVVFEKPRLYKKRLRLA
ncbi:MAG: 1-acyl-sn-glycerol-3-phosphate acyltransferase, partial [Bacilli bacterium]|nr:1-acyl-sn-glycerol-3-phosphate acyltransferase [Bacilli bacterium]